jgi:hypothetical protein
MTIGAITLGFTWVAGYAWAQGGLTAPVDASAVSEPTRVAVTPGVHGYGNATPLPSPTASPTAAPAPKRTKRAKPAPPVGLPVAPMAGAWTGPVADAGTVLPDEQFPAGEDPVTQTVPGPSGAGSSGAGSSGSGTEFTMASFNLLGSSHTNGRGHSPGMASGPARMSGALQILAGHQISVVGLQEFQPDQRQAFQSRATGWSMYPGLSMGRRAGENSVAWRDDTWELVRPGLVDIPYFHGRIRPMPYVLLKHRQTGAQAYFSTFHNPANVGGNMQRHRNEATRRQIVLFNRLHATGVPQFVTGDMNERSEYFCAVTGSTPLVAAAGGSNDGGCRPPKPINIDWIFGSPTARFSGYQVDRSPLVRRTTDHPVIVAHVTLPSRS